MGWSVRYNFPFSVKDSPNSRPYYIPGYGVRDNHLNVSLSVAYTLPLHRDKPKKEVLQPKPDAVVDDVVVPERKE